METDHIRDFDFQKAFVAKCWSGRLQPAGGDGLSRHFLASTQIAADHHRIGASAGRGRAATEGGIAMSSIRLVFALVVGLPLAACVIDPPSRTSSESSNSTTLSGFVGSPSQAITSQAVDQNTGQLVTLGAATSVSSATPYTAPTGVSYKLYQWSFNTGVLPANLWSPQTIVPDLSTGQGHLEIFASAGGQNLYTFSQPARDSWLASGKDLVASTPQYSDGTSTVLFDQDGVGSGPETGWVTVQGMISNSHSPYYSPVAWSVGYYTVEGGKKIYGLICAPTEGGPYPVVIYNHGGPTEATSTSAGQTSATAAA
jgi:hypothetical protein